MSTSFDSFGERTTHWSLMLNTILISFFASKATNHLRYHLRFKVPHLTAKVTAWEQVSVLCLLSLNSNLTTENKIRGAVHSFPKNPKMVSGLQFKLN